MRDDEFMINVMSDLTTRGYDPDSLPLNHVDCVELFRSRLLLTRTVKKFCLALAINEKALACQIMNPGSLPPCILHGLMRMTEKILQQLMLAGLRKNPSGKMFSDYCKRVSSTVNAKILGRSEVNMNTGQWKVPLDKKDPKKLGEVKLSGSMAKKFMLGFDDFVEVCTADHSTEFSDLWKMTCSKFRSTMSMLESKFHFEQEDIDEFQLSADEFCDLYVDLTGRDGMTNYFHNLRAGHFSFFLAKYGNLYLLSQQGWENVNSRFKRLFHFNTQKGGGIGGSSKLGPVMYTMARSMLWKYGYLDGLFEMLGHTKDLDISYGDIKRVPQMNCETDHVTKLFADTILKLGDHADLYGTTESATMLEVIDEFEQDDGLTGQA